MPGLIQRIRAALRRVFFWLPSATPSEEHAPEAAHDHALILAVTSPRAIPRLRQLRYAGRVLSSGERRTMLLALLVFLLSTGTALGFLLNERTLRVPAVGGTFSEALVGEPKHLNPIDAPANDVDRDISSLVYSGLFRMKGMEPEPDLAERYEWSPDGKTLTVMIRSDARFHNGQGITADDVQFTIDAIQDPARSSPLAPRFRGVKATATDVHTIQFTLDRPDVMFLTDLTVGIIPASLWQDIPAANARLADLNLKPIGSGPYRFKSFTRDSKGSLRSLTLERFDRYYGVKPYLKTVVFQFYPDRRQAEDALKGELVDALAFSHVASEGSKSESARWHTMHLELPQETVAFFNLKQSPLNDENTRRALAGVIDRQEAVDAWRGKAVPVSGPFPFTEASTTLVTLEESRALLEKAGWVLPQDASVRVAKTASTSTPPTELSITIVTSQQPELVATAEMLKRRWSLLGVKVEVQQLEPEPLLRVATRDRNAHIIVTNVLLGPEQDLYPFWWSGQASNRGLNISGLADRDVDAAIENVRKATTTEALAAARSQLSALILRSTPAVNLVRPQSPYLVAKKIHGVSPNLVISRPADRFQDLMNWYTKTGWRWK